MSLLLLTFELIRTVECVRALSLFSVHCNAKVDCVFELSKKRREKKMTKKREQKKEKKRKEYQKRPEKKREKVRGK